MKFFKGQSIQRNNLGRTSQKIKLNYIAATERDYNQCSIQLQGWPWLRVITSSFCLSTTFMDSVSDHLECISHVLLIILCRSSIRDDAGGQHWHNHVSFWSRGFLQGYSELQGIIFFPFWYKSYSMRHTWPKFTMFHTFNPLKTWWKVNGMWY